MSADLKLNLGSGKYHLPGFVNADLEAGDVRVNLAVVPWPWPDRSAELIVASHILEHFTREGGWNFLKECRRIIAPGGRLLLAVPDLDRFIAARLTGDYRSLAGYRWTSLDDLMGGGEAEENPAWRHRYAYSFGSLAWTLMMCGFRDIAGRGPGEYDNPEYQAISLYMEARL